MGQKRNNGLRIRSKRRTAVMRKRRRRVKVTARAYFKNKVKTLFNIFSKGRSKFPLKIKIYETDEEWLVYSPDQLPRGTPFIVLETATQEDDDLEKEEK